MRIQRQIEAVVPQFNTAATQEPQVGERSKIFLLPGQLHASRIPVQITTILGSCVAICLWDKSMRTGGMNHFLLPGLQDGKESSSRFGDVATQALLEKLMALGCRRRDLVAKIFGGASLFRKATSPTVSLGDKNIAAALEMMKKADIPVVAKDIGGVDGRKIVFHTDCGSAWSRYL